MNRLGMPVSDDTILRLLKLRASALGSLTTIRVAGIDDWSWRKGCTYGTIVVDLERREVVDVLPDRSTVGTAEWLSRHPEIEIISRDRGGLYAQGEPDVEFLDVFASKNASESHGEPTHGGEIRRGAFQGIDLDCLTGRQQPARLDAKRRRDDGRDQPTRRGIDGAQGRYNRRRRQSRGGRTQGDNLGAFRASRASPLRQKAFKMREAAGVAAQFDLTEQFLSTNAALRPAAR